MGIAGDMVASLHRFDIPDAMRQEIVTHLIEVMNDPNFAYRFVRECGEDFEELSENDMMRIWWAMVALLKKTQT
jgi:hypothetical protein